MAVKATQIQRVLTRRLLRGKHTRTMMAYLLLASAGGFLEKRATGVLELVAGQAPQNAEGPSQ